MGDGLAMATSKGYGTCNGNTPILTLSAVSFSLHCPREVCRGSSRRHHRGVFGCGQFAGEKNERLVDLVWHKCSQMHFLHYHLLKRRSRVILVRQLRTYCLSCISIIQYYVIFRFTCLRFLPSGCKNYSIHYIGYLRRHSRALIYSNIGDAIAVRGSRSCGAA